MAALTELLQEIEKHMALTNESVGQFGINAVGDPGFISKLRRGRDIRLSTMDKARDYMAKKISTQHDAFKRAKDEIAARKGGA